MDADSSRLEKGRQLNQSDVVGLAGNRGLRQLVD